MLLLYLLPESSASEGSNSLPSPNPAVCFIDNMNERKHLERQLSASQRDELLIKEARDENESRKELRETLAQSNELFAKTLQSVSASVMAVANAMNRSMEMMAHASGPQQPSPPPNIIIIWDNNTHIQHSSICHLLHLQSLRTQIITEHLLKIWLINVHTVISFCFNNQTVKLYLGMYVVV